MSRLNVSVEEPLKQIQIGLGLLDQENNRNTSVSSRQNGFTQLTGKRNASSFRGHTSRTAPAGWVLRSAWRSERMRPLVSRPLRWSTSTLTSLSILFERGYMAFRSMRLWCQICIRSDLPQKNSLAGPEKQPRESKTNPSLSKPWYYSFWHFQYCREFGFRPLATWEIISM